MDIYKLSIVWIAADGAAGLGAIHYVVLFIEGHTAVRAGSLYVDIFRDAEEVCIRMAAFTDVRNIAVLACFPAQVAAERGAAVAFVLSPTRLNRHAVPEGDVAEILVIIPVADGTGRASAGLGKHRAPKDLHIAAAFAAESSEVSVIF